jgi:hypothetical protein
MLTLVESDVPKSKDPTTVIGCCACAASGPKGGNKVGLNPAERPNSILSDPGTCVTEHTQDVDDDPSPSEFFSL